MNLTLKDKQKLFGLFILSYALLYVLGMITPLHDWGFTWDLSRLDYMFFLMPFAGFFLMFFSIDWMDRLLEEDFAKSHYFALYFFASSLAAFYVAVYWFYGNVSLLQGQGKSPAEFFDFWPVLLDSAFLVFVFSALLGWVSYKAIESGKKK